MLTAFYNKIIIADASILLAFTHIHRLALLQELCPNLITTPEIDEEYKDTMPSWVHIVKVQNSAITKSISFILGLGESSAIALALESQNPLIILDDKRARAYAKNLGLNYIGVIGLLRLGYKQGIIKDIEIIISELKANHFYLPENCLELIRK